MEFFARFLSWDYLFGNLLWSVLLTAVVAVWRRYLQSRFPAGLRGVRWLALTLGSCFLALSALSYIARPASNVPELRPKIEFATISQIKPPDRPEQSAIALVVTIVNTGAASVARAFTLRLDIPGRGSIVIRRTSEIEDHLDFPDAIPMASTYRFFQSDALVLKTSEMPIQTGAAPKGVVLFMTDIPQRELFQAGSRMTFTVADVLGRETSDSAAIVSDTTNQKLFFPGLKSGPVPSDQSRD